MEELKPCPFCGSTATLQCDAWVACDNDNCGCELTISINAEEAIAQWNTRVPDGGESTDV